VKPSFPASLASIALLLALAPACSSDPASGGATTSTGTGESGKCSQIKFGGDRPVNLHVPRSYKCGTKAPLVMMLHGYTASGFLEEAYLGITPVSEKRGFLYVAPDGTVDADKNGFWNATDACCNFGNSTVDDSAYLSGLIAEIEKAYDVDEKRVYVVGHSNGGFMAYRMACEHGDQIAGIAALAGAMWQDTSKCPAKTAVSVLAIHGTADTVIPYTGGANNGHAFPSAETTIADWVKIDQCGTTADTSGAPLDLDSSLAGNETKVTAYKGCASGTNVALWSMQGGSHVPMITDAFIPDIVDFLYAQQKP
jgi:polyhydroxybutyrate depolymerase